jgi:hypothetical protein
MSDDRKTVWTVKVRPDVTVRLDDIPARDFAACEASTGANWLTLVSAPLRESKWALAMYELACRLGGVEPEPDLSLRQKKDPYELADDDLPVTYSAGLPDPKADAPPTVGSPPST